MKTNLETSKTLKINLNRITFRTLFAVVFCFSGLLTVVTGFQYRAALASLLVVPSLLLYGIRPNIVNLTYSGLFGVVVLSALINQSSVIQVVLFLRILIFSFLIFYIVQKFVTSRSIVPLIRACVVIAAFQLPVVVLQLFAYDYIPTSWASRVTRQDFVFGTFNFSTDYAMTFFLTLLVAYLLFNHEKNRIIKHKWLVVLWLTFTVIIANAQIVKLFLFIVWGVYLTTHFRLKVLLATTITGLLITGASVWLSNHGILAENVFTFVVRLLPNEERVLSQDSYLASEYSRHAAIVYLLTEGFTLFGDGPSQYYDVFSRTRLRGNTGHFFTFFSEVGSVGWLLSVLIFFFIAFPIRKGKLLISWMRVLMFVGINMLAFTAQVMNDVGVMLTYCLFAKLHLIELARPKSNYLSK